MNDDLWADALRIIPAHLFLFSLKLEYTRSVFGSSFTPYPRKGILDALARGCYSSSYGTPISQSSGAGCRLLSTVKTEEIENSSRWPRASPLD